MSTAILLLSVLIASQNASSRAADAMEVDLARLARAAGQLVGTWPGQAPPAIAEVQVVARHGRRVAPLLLALLSDDSDAERNVKQRGAEFVSEHDTRVGQVLRPRAGDLLYMPVRDRHRPQWLGRQTSATLRGSTGCTASSGGRRHLDVAAEISRSDARSRSDTTEIDGAF